MNNQILWSSVICAALLSSCCSPEGIKDISPDVRGRVYDAATLKPLSGAQIKFNPHSRLIGGSRQKNFSGTRTSEDGSFHLAPKREFQWRCWSMFDSQPPYYIDFLITHPGYQSLVTDDLQISGLKPDGSGKIVAKLPRPYPIRPYPTPLTAPAAKDMEKDAKHWSNDDEKFEHPRYFVDIFLRPLER